jgi:FAD/FMN-containing dehydrogenase
MQLPFAILVSLAVSGARSEYTKAYEACSSLSQILPGRVSFPQSQGYEDSLSSYAFIGTRLRPACIVSPKATGDVVTIIQTMGNFEAVPFAVRSGGHNTNIGTSHCMMGRVSYSDPNTGFANVQNGVTIDLSELNSVTLESSARTVFVGPGARWQSVYNTLDPYGLTVQGGRNGKVGVAGFLTGGTHVFFSILFVPY